MKMCIACGMPMMQIADYPLYDISKNYCKHCAHIDGSMLTFAEKLAYLTELYIVNHQMDDIIAEQIAIVILRKLPAWRRK